MFRIHIHIFSRVMIRRPIVSTFVRWHRKVYGRLIFAFLFLISPCYGQMHGTVKGVIRDAADGTPLPGANIIIERTMLGASSDLTGSFTIPRIPPGTYSLKATMMGFRPFRQSITVEAGKTFHLTITMHQTVINMPDVVVTAGKKAQSFQDVPNSVAVISSRQIRQKNLFYVSDILEYTPGVTMVRGDVNIRGSSGFALGAGSRVLLLVDGIPMMPGDSGNIKWDIIPMSQVERIEVVKGAGSALYGSHALGGVVNVISKEPTDRPYTELQFSAGVYDRPYYDEWRWTNRLLNFNQTDITHSQRIGNFGILLSAGRRESTGYQENGFYKRYNILGVLNYHFSSQKQLTLQSNWTTGKNGETLMWRNQNDVLEMPLPNIGDWTEAEKYSLNMVFRHLVNSRFTYKIRTSYFYNEFFQHYHDVQALSKAHKLGFEWQADYLWRKNHAFTFGIEGIGDITRSAMFGNHEANTMAAYIQDEIRLYNWLTATLGCRYDYHHIDIGVEDNQINPKFGLNFKPTLLTTVRFSMGRGFRSPTMAEMFSQTSISGFRLLPSSDLLAEKAWSYEIGINQILSDNLLLDAALFHNDYWNFIEPQPDIQNQVQFINVNRARIRGGEISLQAAWFRQKLTTQVSYTYLDPTDRVTGNDLAYRSRHALVSSMNIQFGRLEAGLDGRYASRIKEVKVYPDEDRVDQQVLDARLAWRWNNGTITLNINNMLNYNYVQVERNLAPIRHYMLTVIMHR